MFNKWRPPHRQPNLIRAERSHTSPSYLDGMIFFFVLTSLAGVHTRVRKQYFCTLFKYLSASSCGQRVWSAPWSHCWNEMEMYDAARSPEIRRVSNHYSFNLVCPGLVISQCYVFVYLCGLCWINEAVCGMISTLLILFRLCVTTGHV